VQTEDIHQQLAAEYLSVMENRELSRKRVCVIFSGVPGSGKTTLARKLAHDLQAQYIRHDDIRELARKHGYNVIKLTISSISRIVMDTIMDEDANKFVIVDASLDRTWPLFFEHTTEHGALPIIIRLDVPRAIAKKRVSERGADDFGSVGDLDRFYTEFENSKKHVPATMTLGADYDYGDVLRQIKKLTK
jgi:dephospho-CoA kinase